MVNEKLWIEFDTPVIKETIIFGEKGYVRITHHTMPKIGSKKIMLRGFIELNDDKLDYIMPYEASDLNV